MIVSVKPLRLAFPSVVMDEIKGFPLIHQDVSNTGYGGCRDKTGLQNSLGESARQDRSLIRA